MTTRSASELEELLAEDLGHAIERERTAFDRLTAKSPAALVLPGAANLGRTVARQLCAAGIRPVAFADNNPALWGHAIEDVPVLSPADAAQRYGAAAAFVITIWGVGSSDRMATRERQL